MTAPAPTTAADATGAPDTTSPSQSKAHCDRCAYESVEGISTSSEHRECRPGEAADRQSFIRSVLTADLTADLAAELAVSTTQLHSDSVTASNDDAYFDVTEIDGGLVGTASQELTSYQTLRTSITAHRSVRKDIHENTLENVPRPGSGTG